MCVEPVSIQVVNATGKKSWDYRDFSKGVPKLIFIQGSDQMQFDCVAEECKQKKEKRKEKKIKEKIKVVDFGLILYGFLLLMEID